MQKIMKPISEYSLNFEFIIEIEITSEYCIVSDEIIILIRRDTSYIISFDKEKAFTIPVICNGKCISIKYVIDSLSSEIMLLSVVIH